MVKDLIRVDSDVGIIGMMNFSNIHLFSEKAEQTEPKGELLFNYIADVFLTFLEGKHGTRS